MQLLKLYSKRHIKRKRIYITSDNRIYRPYQLNSGEQKTAMIEVISQLEKWFNSVTEPNKQVATNVTTHDVAHYLLAEFIHKNYATILQLKNSDINGNHI